MLLCLYSGLAFNKNARGESRIAACPEHSFMLLTAVSAWCPPKGLPAPPLTSPRPPPPGVPRGRGSLRLPRGDAGRPPLSGLPSPPSADQPRRTPALLQAPAAAVTASRYPGIWRRPCGHRAGPTGGRYPTGAGPGPCLLLSGHPRPCGPGPLTGMGSRCPPLALWCRVSLEVKLGQELPWRPWTSWAHRTASGGLEALASPCPPGCHADLASSRLRFSVVGTMSRLLTKTLDS